MKKIFSIFFILIFASVSFAQSADWMRVQSENGEVSFLIPPKFNYFFSDKGVNSQQGFQLSKMNLIRGLSEDTQVSFESYQASKSFLNEFIDSDSLKIGNNEVTVKKNKQGEIEFKELNIKSDDSYLIRRYFYLGKNICIFTAASRKGKTALMTKFLDSIEFKTRLTNNNVSIPKISSLAMTQVEIVSKGVKPIEDSEKYNKNRPSASLLLRPRASFTDNTRGISGTVRLRFHYLETGFVNKIEIVNPVSMELTWQVISSLIKSIRLPVEADGKPIAGQSIYEYTFTTY